MAIERGQPYTVGSPLHLEGRRARIESRLVLAMAALKGSEKVGQAFEAIKRRDIIVADELETQKWVYQINDEDYVRSRARDEIGRSLYAASRGYTQITKEGNLISHDKVPINRNLARRAKAVLGIG